MLTAIDCQKKMFNILKSHRLGKNMTACMLFANTYPHWHGFSKDRSTQEAVKRLHKIGLLEVNEFRQFRSIKWSYKQDCKNRKK